MKIVTNVISMPPPACKRAHSPTVQTCMHNTHWTGELPAQFLSCSIGDITTNPYSDSETWPIKSLGFGHRRAGMMQSHWDLPPAALYCNWWHIKIMKNMSVADSVVLIFTTCSTELQLSKGGANHTLNYHADALTSKGLPLLQAYSQS